MLAALEVDGVAELAHAGVDGDEAEEDAQGEEDDAEVHPAAGVVGVPDGVALAAAPEVVLVAVPLVVVVRVVRVGPVGPVRLVVVERAAGGAHALQERGPGAVPGGVGGPAGADDGGGGVVDGDARQHLGRAGVPAPDGRVGGGAGVSDRLQELGGGVSRTGPPAPHHGRAALGRALGRGQPRRVHSPGEGPGGAWGAGELHPEAHVVDDDLRGVGRHLHRTQRGLVVVPGRASPRRCAGCSGVHTHLTE